MFEDRKMMCKRLNDAEDLVEAVLDDVMIGSYSANLEWMRTARTDMAKGFMAARRSLYGGKREGCE